MTTEANVEKEDELSSAIEKTVKELKPIDILINNVGYDLQALIHEVTSEQWDKCININLKAYQYFFNCGNRPSEGYAGIIEKV